MCMLPPMCITRGDSGKKKISLQHMISDYIVEKLIGKGAYGCVYLAKNKHTNRPYAMKKLDLSKATHYEKTSIVNELRILSTHKSPFIIKFKTAIFEKNYLHLITEYAEKGDLAQLIILKSRRNEKISENDVWHYFLQVSVALSYLHNMQIIHRDLKPANVFIDANNNVKLGDFGISKVMKSYMMYGRTQIGTPLYMSPEIYKRELYDSKADMWALGCILYEMIMLKPAFTGANIHDLKLRIYSGRINDNRLYSLELKNIISKLINVHPRLRPSIVTLLNVPFVKQQLKERKLEFALLDDMKPTFNVICVIPRRVEEWNNVVSLFVTLNATIVLDQEEQHNIDAVSIAKTNIENKKRTNACKLIELNANIPQVTEELVNARKLVTNLEIKLKGLQNEKNALLAKPELKRR